MFSPRLPIPLSVHDYDCFTAGIESERCPQHIKLFKNYISPQPTEYSVLSLGIWLADTDMS